MSSPTSDHNPKTNTPDVMAKKQNLNYISKFGLYANVAHLIDSRLIFHDVHIDDLLIALDLKLNSWVLYILENYQLSLTLVIDLMLKVFCEKFHRWGNKEFSRLDKYITQVLKKSFMTKEIYMGRPSGHVNQRKANFVINE